MWRLSEVFLAFFPAAVLFFFAGWAGTLAGAASGLWPALGHALLLAGVLLAARYLLDPLGLGRSGGLLLLAALAAWVFSWYGSPVPRAGLLALLALPAYLLLPRVVEICWRASARRRLGLRAVSLGFAGVAGWSLAIAWLQGEPVASPLGHHNLLATWLLTLLPVAILTWTEGGRWRVVAASAGGLGLFAVAGTRSLSAALTVACLAVAVAIGKRRWILVMAVAALLLLPQAGRLVGLWSSDSSWQVRRGYLEAGWRGFLERPVFGWGPGSTPWTVSRHLRPTPGVHPPGEVVPDLHALPLQLAYELGISGCLLIAGVGLIFWRRRRLKVSDAADPGLRRAAGYGAAAFGIMSCGGLPLSVPALPVALAVVLGTWWAAGGEPEEAPVVPSGRPYATVLVALTVIFAGPLHLGRAVYERAVSLLEPGEQAEALRRAVELDPAFPLYRARLAWLERELPGDAGDGVEPDVAAGRMLAAAEDAGDVALLWLLAGVMGAESEQTWSFEALDRACLLDPLGAFAPYHLAINEHPHPLGPEWGARALVSDPDLLAATAWRGQPRLLAAAVVWASEMEDLAPGWRRRLRETLNAGLPYSGEIRRKALRLDATPEFSFSLYAFRRTPWPGELLAVELDRGVLESLDLVSLARQSSTAPGVLAYRDYCALADSP